MRQILFRHALFICFVGCLAAVARADEFRIVDVTPHASASGVSIESAIQAHTSTAFDPKTLTEENVRLLDADGSKVPAHVSGDLGGVITISADGPLLPFARYTIKISSDVKSSKGLALEPFTSSFETGSVDSRVTPPTTALPAWRKVNLDKPLGATAVALGPDGRLYVATWEGDLYRYDVEPTTGKTGPRELVWQKPGGRIIGLTFDPDATAEAPLLWIGYDDRGGLSVDDLHFTGTISRLRLFADGAAPQEEPVIVHLPNGDHPMNQFVFGPDGRMYVSIGGITMLGAGPPARRETVLSAAVLVADIRSATFNEGRLPLDADTRSPIKYDPYHPNSPLQIFATGIREAYDLCWHTNGQLYAGVNMNDTAEQSPSDGKVPSLSVRPDEPLIRIVKGQYYGQPNPERGQYVVQGGNPTSGPDPWEITQYPVGVQPEPDFDPELLVFNLSEVGGPSANGCAEWLGAGPMQGRLVICFYTSTRGIHTFKFNPDGTAVVDQQPLRNASGHTLQFGAPLDLAIDHHHGRIYVVDFADPRRGDSAEQGALWLVEME